MEVNDVEFRVMLDLFMASDSWPLGDNYSHSVMNDMLNRMAQTRGYQDWIDAYHRHEPR